jgi:hypothetical protein
VADSVAGAEYEVTALRYGTRTARSSEVFLNFELYQEPDREPAMDYFLFPSVELDDGLHLAKVSLAGGHPSLTHS